MLADPADAPVPPQYKKYFQKFESSRSLPSSILRANSIGDQEIGRSYALIAGVSHYPSLPVGKNSLPPAKVDVDRLVKFLREREYFDEIVVLEDDDVTVNNLTFFLQGYFPSRMGSQKNSRFLFAYSGHGFDDATSSYILTSSAQSMTDPYRSIDIDELKILIEKVVSKALDTLVLINSCQAGAFLGDISFGADTPIPKDIIIPKFGAHAITAGARQKDTFASPSQGRGSYFFEELLAAIDHSSESLIPVASLYRDVSRGVHLDTNGDQDPQMGDIAPKHSSQGSFFFVNASHSSGKTPQTANSTEPVEYDANSCNGELILDYYSYAVVHALQDDFARIIDEKGWARLKVAGGDASSVLFTKGKSFLGGIYSLADDYATFEKKRDDHFKAVYYSRNLDQAIRILRMTVATREYPAYSACLRKSTAGLRVWAARETLNEIELHVRRSDQTGSAIRLKGEISGGNIPGMSAGHLWEDEIAFSPGEERVFTIERDRNTSDVAIAIAGTDRTGPSVSVRFERADGILRTTYVGTQDVLRQANRRVVAHTPDNNENRGGCPNYVGHHDGKYCTSRTTLTIRTTAPRFLKNPKVDCAGIGCPWTSVGAATISADGLTATAFLDNWGSAVDAILSADEYEHVSASQCGSDGAVAVLKDKPILLAVNQECLAQAMVKWTLLPDLSEGIFKFGDASSAGGEVVMNGSLLRMNNAAVASYSVRSVR